MSSVSIKDSGGVAVRVANPDDLRLEVTAEFSVAMWKAILASLEKAPYYAPLRDFQDAVQHCINDIEKRVPLAITRDTLGRKV